jgi:isopenicillin-N epimerase
MMATDTMKPTSTSAPSAAELRSMFLLDPEVIFLNHGSFGACPKPVFDSYQHWQRELERQPVEFIQRRQDDLIDSARGRLASELNVSPDDVVFVPNATSGLNVFARSMKLQPGDEILATDHEYGALNLTWQHVCARTGAKYVQQEIPLPVTTPEAMIETLWQGVTDRTKVIFLSHLTSPTALIFPVAEICHRAREAGIISIIDGAHAPGQLPLDLTAIGADVYSGNCHKWMCSPKGAAFLYVRPEHQEIVEALTVSWGWGEGFRPYAGESRSQFIRRNQWQGTRDSASYIAVPPALDFLAENQWDLVRERCHQQLLDVSDRIAGLTGLPPIAPATQGWTVQFGAIPLPAVDAPSLKQRLWDDYHIEVPLSGYAGQTMLRVSVQGYVSDADLDHLVDALETVLPEYAA